MQQTADFEYNKISEIYPRVYAAIDLDAFVYNLEHIKANTAAGTKVIAVVKTDAYGHGALPLAREAEGFDYVWGFAVATIEEAKSLRLGGIAKPILILGYTFPGACADIVRYDFRPAVFTLSMAQQLSEECVKQKKTVKLHIKLDTGMSRIGIRPSQESLELILKMKELPGLELEGIFTHFSKSDEADKEPSYRQMEQFQQFLKLCEEAGVTFSMRHCANSGGTVDLTEAHYDAVRPGIILYGMYPSFEVHQERVPLKPVLSLKSQVIYVKEIEAGTSVSYGGTYTAGEKRRIATVPVGYGDGYPRALSGKGFVLIRGQRAPILGRVCMDQFMVDVTDIPGAAEGDVVTLVGCDGDDRIHVEELSALCGRFNYEFVCDLGKRIPRAYIKEGRLTETIDYF